MSDDFNSLNSLAYHRRILALEKLGAVFNQVAFPLQYTPRKFVIHPESNNLIIIETDHNAYTEATKAQRKQQMAEEMVEAAWKNLVVPASESNPEWENVLDEKAKPSQQLLKEA